LLNFLFFVQFTTVVTMETDSNKKKAKISKNRHSVDYSRKEIELLLPNLTKELHAYTDNLSNNSIPDLQNLTRTREEIQKITQSDYDTNSELQFPKTENFIRRCSTLEEAEEIIDYQLKINQITKQQADKLRELCKKHGMRYFGQKKEWGYYERTYRK